ncbi:MAG: hypothetical protein ACOCNV_08750 [Prevotella sp.]
MILSENCKEIFLEGITDAYIYPSVNSVLPVPFAVAQILRMNNCKFGDVLLHIATAEETYVVADTLSAKSTPARNGNGTVFSLEISATITEGKENVRETQRKIAIEGDDYYVVLKREDGTFYLCYSLPSTFTFNASTSTTQTSEQESLTISMKSMSDFIPITIQES